MSYGPTSLKTYQPRRRFRDVLRPRLTRALDEVIEGDAGPLWVLAPDGWGKTTALAAWAARLERPVAWWRFTADDDDPACVIRAFVDSIQEIRPGCGVAARDALGLDDMPPMAAFVEQIRTQLAAGDDPCVLILDDVHLLETESAQEVLAQLCNGPLGPARIVLSGDPVGWSHVPDGVPTLDRDQLRFDAGETREFVDQTADLDLEPDAVQTLHEHSRGRIAVLQLAAQGLARARDRDRFLASLADGASDDELVQALLAGLPRPVREFLERSSVLSRYRDALCDAVTGHDDGGEMIRRLDRLNLFTEALDADHTWFRTHPSLAGPLRDHLAGDDAGEVATLHQRAAVWFDEQELWVEAALHARASGDPEWTAVLVERAAADLMQRGAWETLARWLGEVPEGLLTEHPGLRAVQAWCLMRDGASEPAEEAVQRLLQDTHREDPSPYARDLQGQGCVIQAEVSLDHGDPRIAVELAERGAELLDEENLWVRRRIPAILGVALREDSDLAGAEHGFLEVERVGRYLNDTWTTVLGLCLQAELRVVQGELRGANVLYENAEGFTERHWARRFGPSALIDVGIAELRWHRNHLDEGLQRVELALETLGEWRATDLRTRALAMRARLLRSRGEFEKAEQSLDLVEEVARAAGVSPGAQTFASAERARIWLARGELDRVESWATGSDRKDRGALLVREMEGLVVARLFLALGRHDEALALLARMEQDAAAARRRGRVIEIRILQALGRYGQERREKALSRLGRALRRAMRERMVRLFLDEGEPMAEVLRHGVERNIWVRPEIQPFAQALLAAHGDGADGDGAGGDGAGGEGDETG